MLCGYYGCANRVDGQINLLVLVREDLPDLPVASCQKKSLTEKNGQIRPRAKKKDSLIAYVRGRLFLCPRLDKYLYVVGAFDWQQKDQYIVRNKGTEVLFYIQ